MGVSPSRWLERVPPIVVDSAWGALLALLSLRLAAEHYPPHHRPFDALAWALTLLANGALALRRRAPMTVLVVSTASVAAFQLAGYWPALNQLGPPLTLYSLATMRTRWWTLAGAAIVAPVMLAGHLRTWTGSPVDVVVQTSAWVVTLVAFGTGTRRHVERGQALAELTARLRREQEDREQRAVTAERVRIARELHDVVAHHMAVISVQTGLAWYILDSDPGTARTALRTASDVSHEALDEMRRMLAVLRIEVDETGDDRDYHPSPGLDGIEQLANRVRLAGVPVTVTVTGTRRPLAQGIELCAYRVIQESLTNVVRHARPASADVTLAYGSDELTVRVTDEGRAVPAATVPPGGHGLIGMRERARLYGGSVHAGPRTDGLGYEVVLRLPATRADDRAEPAAPETTVP